MAASYGSKATTALCQPLVTMSSAFRFYRIPLGGGGAIWKRKPSALRNIGIDLNRRSIDGIRCDRPVELHHGCAHRFLSYFDFDGRELVYSDPRCVQSARKSRRLNRFDYTEDDHVELLDILKSLPRQFDDLRPQVFRGQLPRLRPAPSRRARVMGDPDVSFTNNAEERKIRMAKVKMKESGWFRTVAFAQAWCLISSYLRSMAALGNSPLVTIQTALAGKAADMIKLHHVQLVPKNE